MAGLFGLFGKKEDSNSQEATGGSFYLDSDAAKGLGDMDRFKNMAPVKKTFPVEVETSTSGTATTNSVTNTISSEVTEESSSKAERRRADSSMDMFRNLAREIKKP
jgi:hypothetical protein